MGDVDHKEIHMVEFMIHLPCVAFYCLKHGRVNEYELLVCKFFASHILVYMGISLREQRLSDCPSSQTARLARSQHL